VHIGIISEHSDPARGGAERYVEALADRIQAHGHAVTWFARTGPRAQKVPGGPRALRPRSYARAFLPRLKEAGADVVLATSPAPGCDFYQPHNGVLAASTPPRLEPLAWPLRLVRQANPHRILHFALLRRQEARAMQPPTKVLAISPRVQVDVGRHHPGATVLLRRSGVDLERFRPGRKESGPPLLLFVAQNFRLKGLRTVLDALARLPDARLVVVGRDRPLPSARVEYRGYVDDLPTLYRRAHLLVHPTYYDTASRVVMEALASGTPAITTRRDGNADLAEEGGGAALDRPGDAAALAAAVERILAAPQPERARAVAERFPATEMFDRVVETLTEQCAS
jgi:UDP-glucose:(heptosyl)LPS alpha-1,3-glucosyltransferase